MTIRKIDDDLTRLEGRPISECCWRSAMWRRSYDVALHAISVKEERERRLRQEQWDSPMVFFYEKYGETP